MCAEDTQNMSQLCQEIGLVAFMFFFELLFPYVFLQFPSMFPLTKLILTHSFSLSANYSRHSKQRRSKNLIQLIQEKSKILFYNSRISQDSQTNH